jgi:hypothetical protein
MGEFLMLIAVFALRRLLHPGGEEFTHVHFISVHSACEGCALRRSICCNSDAGSAVQFWVTKYPPTSEENRDLHLMTGFMAGAAADAASKLSEKIIVSKTLAQLDKIFGEHPHLGSRKHEQLKLR